MHRLGNAALALVGSVPALAACASAPPPPPQPEPPPPKVAPASKEALPSSGWDTLVAPRFLLRFRLPDAARWRVDEKATTWFAAEHAPSESTLVLRAWRADEAVNGRDCEASARALGADRIPQPTPESLVDMIDLGKPDGYDTQVIVGVREVPDGIEGYSLAFGAKARRCLAVIFTTRARGPGAEMAIGQRLVLFSDRVLPSLEAYQIGDHAARTPQLSR